MPTLSPVNTKQIISGNDIGHLMGLPILTLISWLLPVQMAPWFCRTMAFMNAATLTSGKVALTRRIYQHVGDFDISLNPSEIPDAVAGEDLLALVSLLKTHLTRSWKGTTEIHGREFLDAALRKGNGAILWRAHFVHYGIPYYKALVDAGFHFTHISHVRHGFSESRFGIKYLNPIRLHAENRFVPERLQLTGGAPTVVLRNAHRRLAENGIVSITTRGDADNYISAPFLNGTHNVAPGAPRLAYAQGADLLPVFPIRNPNGSHSIIIEPPITIDRSQESRVVAENAANEFVNRLKSRVLQYPSQWLGWMHL